MSFSLPTLKSNILVKGRVIRESSTGSGIIFFDDADTKKSRAIISDFVRQSSKPQAGFSNEDFLEVLKNHKTLDQHNIREIFYLASKLLLFRSEFTKKSLKRKEICQAVDLVRKHMDKGFAFEAKGALKENFGDYDHSAAMDYYGKCVQGRIKDFYGRDVLIDEEGIEFLFKDPQTGKHDKDMKPENYQPPRGRRLPWLRHVICNSDEVYEHFELQRQENIYYYVGKAIITLPDKVVPNYFLIVTYKKKGEPITFKTAYFLEDKIELFKKICRGKVFTPQVISTEQVA